MPIKNVAVQVKATAADDTTLKDGQFIALAAVFGNVDAVGDVVMPGAFAADLKAWEESGDTIPVYWAHQMSNPNMNIGAVLKAEETADGLLVKAQLDLDTTEGKQVYRLLKGRRVNRMSFAYDILDAAPAERDGEAVYELRALKLHEVSVVQVPANPAAVVQEVKTLTAPYAAVAGLPPTGQWMFITTPTTQPTKTTPAAPVTPMPDTTTTTITVAGPDPAPPSDDGKATPAQPAATSPSGAKDDAPARPGPASTGLTLALAAAVAEATSFTEC